MSITENTLVLTLTCHSGCLRWIPDEYKVKLIGTQKPRRDAQVTAGKPRINHSNSMGNYVLVLIWNEKIQMLGAFHLILNKFATSPYLYQWQSALIQLPMTATFCSSGSVFCMHNSSNDSSTMYCFPECGTNEVVSCFNHYLSDNAVYRFMLRANKIVIHFLFSSVQMGRFKLIQHYFLVRSHSVLPCNRDLQRQKVRSARLSMYIFLTTGMKS